MDLPKYLPGQVIASANRSGVIVSAFKRRFGDDTNAPECWGYNIKSVDRRVILERDIIAVMDEEKGEWAEVSND